VTTLSSSTQQTFSRQFIIDKNSCGPKKNVKYFDEIICKLLHTLRDFASKNVCSAEVVALMCLNIVACNHQKTLDVKLSKQWEERHLPSQDKLCMHNSLRVKCRPSVLACWRDANKNRSELYLHFSSACASQLHEWRATHTEKFCTARARESVCVIEQSAVKTCRLLKV
jgi:hypothetical protein